MSDDTPPPTSAPTPAGNQNLIIGLVLGAAVLLLFILALNMRDKGIGVTGGAPSEVETLRKELKNRRSFINEERRRMGLPPLGDEVAGQSVEALAARINNDSTDLVTMVRQMQILLAEEEQRLAEADTTFAALTRQNTDLLTQVAQLQGSAQDAESLRIRLANAQSLYETAQERIADLQEQIAGTPIKSEMDNLRQQLENTLANRDKLQTEVVVLRDESKTLRAENNELRYELQKTRAELSRTRLFVDSADKLPAAAKTLFVRLAELETLNGPELTAEYAKIGTQLKARVLDTIDFQSGSSRINLDKAQETRLAVQASGEKSFFLIVGYASKTGDFQTNQKLSAERATTIASVVDFNKKSTQNVQAVFLSQTDRFSPTDVQKNHICEIWEIQE
jgi:outer membrane protein OmpA-like peptidoglycan-associated protein